MSLKSLMAQKKQLNKISHPLARYDARGQLHCRICTPSLVKSEQLWGSHLTSKSHRQNALVQQQKEEEERSRKRALEQAEEQDRAKKARTEAEDFMTEDQSNEDLENPATLVNDSLATVAAENEEDPEWAEFERDVLSEPLPSTSRVNGTSNATTYSGEAKTYDEIGQDSTEVQPELIQQEILPGETEEERAAREEREELFQRIEDEEREQQEADQRVVALKARLEAMRAQKKAKLH